MKTTPLAFLSRAAACAAVFLTCSFARAQTWTQTVGGAYNWNDNANWSAAFPNAIDATADITGDFAGDQTISLNVATTVGSLTIGDSGASGDSVVTIDAGVSGSLTFQASSGTATMTTTSMGGNTTPVTNTISAPITVASDTIINPGNLGSSGQGSGILLSGAISGSGNITVVGSASGSSRSTLTLSGNNSSYTGNWTLSGDSSTTANSGAGIAITNDNNLGAVPVSPSTNITVTAGDDPVIRFSGSVNLNANRNIVVENGGKLTLIQDNIATSTINGVISGAGGVSINGSSISRKIRLSGSNTYTGATSIGQGTLTVGSTTALGVNSAVSFANSSQSLLDLNNISISIGSLSGGGSNGGAITLGSGTLTSGGLNTDSTFAGKISETGGFTKIGSGTQTFTNANTYTGATNVNAGTLLINGTNTGSDVSVSNVGSTLGGSGTLTPGAGNALTVNSGAILAPGVDGAVGLFTVALSDTGDSALFNSGAKFVFELDTPGSTDVLAFTGVTTSVADVTFNSNVIDFTDLGGLAAGSYTLFTFDADNTYSGALAIGTGLESFVGSNLSYNANSIVLNVVPEPATCGLLAFGLAAILFKRRRKV